MVMASSTSQPTDDEKLAGLGKENPTTFEEDGRYLVIEQEVTLEFLRRRELQVPAGQTLSINYPEVQKEARRVFAQKYPEDAVRYTGRKTQTSRRKEESSFGQQSEESPRVAQSVSRNPSNTRSAQGEIPTPPANTGSFEDDLKEGLPENPSVVIDPSYNRALDRSNPLKSVTAGSSSQPDFASTNSPSVEVDPEYQDALENQWASDLANSQARDNRNQRDAAEQEEGSLNDLLNKSPSSNYLPLVGDEGNPVGLSAAYDGLAYGAPGIETGGFGASTEREEPKAQPFSVDEENESEDQEETPNNQQFRAPGTPGEPGQVTGRSNSKRRIKAVEQEIDKKQGEINRLKKRIEAYNKEFIDPLKRAARTAIFIDTVVAIETYMAFTSWWWWATVIGAIIDACIVFPGILIFYGAGIVKGRVGKTVQKNLRKHEPVVKSMQDAKKTLEQQILLLRQRYFQLLQESRNPTQPGQGPASSGGANRPPSTPFSGIGLAS